MTRALCAVCNAEGLKVVWDLPKLPLTGIYVKEPTEAVHNYFHDQLLLHCEVCSHTQLSKQVNPDLLYRSTYSHRTSGSQISRAGNDFLLEHMTRILGSSRLTNVVELGCNDLYLLQGLAGEGRELIGIDPMWRDEDGPTDASVRLSGDFAEDVDYEKLLDGKIDLLVSSHTFEHLFDPRLVVDRLRGQLSDHAVVIIEVPSAERMLAQARLDQVFSQHVHYYSAMSMMRLWEPLGLHLVDLTYNYDYWGGTQILTFMQDSFCPIQIPKAPGIDTFLEGIRVFQDSLRLSVWQMNHASDNVVAFGAAQMLPILDYHLDGLFAQLVCILDDNPARQGMFFPYLDTPIRSAADFLEWSCSTVLISALDSSRPLVRIARERESRSVVVPLGLV